MHVFHATDGASLAAAVAAANKTPGPSEIILDQAGTYNLSAPLTITSNLIITGAKSTAPANYVIQPATGVSGRLVIIAGNRSVVLRDMTFQNGTTRAATAARST